MDKKKKQTMNLSRSKVKKVKVEPQVKVVLSSSSSSEDDEQPSTSSSLTKRITRSSISVSNKTTFSTNQDDSMDRIEELGYISVIKEPGSKEKEDDNDDDDNDDDYYLDDEEIESEIIVEKYIEEAPTYSQVLKSDNIDNELASFLKGANIANHRIVPSQTRNKLPAVWYAIKSNCYKNKDFSSMEKEEKLNLAVDAFETSFPDCNPGLFHVSQWRNYRRTFLLRENLTACQLRTIMASSHPTSWTPDHLLQRKDRPLTCQEIGTIAEEFLKQGTEQLLGCKIHKPDHSFVSEDGLFVCRIDGILRIGDEVFLWEGKHVLPYREKASVKKAIKQLSKRAKESAFLKENNGIIYVNQNHLYGYQLLLMMWILQIFQAKVTVALEGFEIEKPETYHLIEVIDIVVNPEDLKLWYENEAGIANSMIKSAILAPLISGDIDDHGLPTADCPEIDCPHCFEKVAAADWNFHVKSKHLICSDCQAKFSCIDRLNIHRAKKHGAPAKFACPLCPKKFSALQILSQHKERRHPKKLFSCGKCTMTFPTHLAYDNHNRVVHLKKPIHVKKKEVCCLNPKCQQFNQMVLRANLLRHLAQHGQQYNKCRKAWVDAGNDPVEALPYHPGAGKRSKKDDKLGYWMCPGHCEKETTSPKQPVGQRMLWAKESFRFHIKGHKTRVGRHGEKRPALPPCEKYLEWKLKHSNGQWDGTVWRCSCNLHLPKCEKKAIARHTKDCRKYAKFSRKESGAKKPVILPTFNYTPQ